MFIKEYLLILPLVWGSVQVLSSGRPDYEIPDEWEAKILFHPRCWRAATITILLVTPYLIYWSILADRFGVSFVGLKSGHASSNVGFPLVGYVQGLRELLSEPSYLVTQSLKHRIVDLGYRVLHLGFFLMLLFVFFLETPRALLRGFRPRWQGAFHMVLLGLCLFFSSKVTHSAGDLGRVMAASPAFWTVAALRLDRVWWRLAWVFVGCGLFLAQWLRLLTIARNGGFEIEQSLKMIGLN